MAYADSDTYFLVILGGVVMFFMAFGVGANDVANAFGTAFGAKSLNVKQALIIAMIFEFAGAIFLGSHVSGTIRKGILSPESFSGVVGAAQFMAGMFSALGASAMFLFLESKMGMPVSSTHTIVGGVMGFAIAAKGYGSLDWAKVLEIVASWLISPVLAGIMSYIVYWLVRKFVLRAKNPQRRALISIPFFYFLSVSVVLMFLIYKGAKGLGLSDTPLWVALSISCGSGVVSGIIGLMWVVHHDAIAKFLHLSSPEVPSLEADPDALVVEDDDDSSEDEEEEGPSSIKGLAPVRRGSEKKKEEETADPEAVEGDVDQEIVVVQVDEEDKYQEDPNVLEAEEMYHGLVVTVAAFLSLSIGANDLPNAVGPFNGILIAYEEGLKASGEVSIWLLVAGGIGLVVGLAVMGRRVMETVGHKITKISPSRAFCVQLAATFTILVATRLGLPMSTTHASVGAVIGIGFVDGVRKMKWDVLRSVFFSWLITIPIAGFAAGGTFAFMQPTVVDLS